MSETNIEVKKVLKRFLKEEKLYVKNVADSISTSQMTLKHVFDTGSIKFSMIVAISKKYPAFANHFIEILLMYSNEIKTENEEVLIKKLTASEKENKEMKKRLLKIIDFLPVMSEIEKAIKNNTLQLREIQKATNKR